MKLLHSTHSLTQRFAVLLSIGLLAATASEAPAADRHHHGSSHGSTHHYNPHYRVYSNGRTYYRSYDSYQPSVGYYDGYYNDYPVYAPGYRGRSYYPHSDYYGQTRHRGLSFNLFLR